MSIHERKSIVNGMIKNAISKIPMINLGSLDSCSNLKGKECPKAYEKCFVNQCKKYGVYIHDNKKYKLPLDFYFNRLYQAYYYKYMKGDDTGYTILLKQLYSMLSGRDISNSSSIGFTFRYSDITIEYQNKVYNISEFAEILENMLNTSDDLIVTNFNTINSSGTDGHATVLIMEKYDSGWNFYSYDPNGYDNINSDFKTSSLIRELIKHLNKKITVIPITEISCPTSIQKYTDDNIGFCLMFSFFWIYCILTIINDMKKNNAYIPLQYWIGLVDKILIGCEKSYLYSVVVSFGIKLVNDTAVDSDIFNKEPNLFEMNKNLPSSDSVYKTPTIKLGFIIPEMSKNVFSKVSWAVKCNKIDYNGFLIYSNGVLKWQMYITDFRDIEVSIPEFRFLLLFTEYMIKYCRKIVNFNKIEINQSEYTEWMTYLGFNKSGSTSYENFLDHCRENTTYAGSHLYNLDKFILERIPDMISEYKMTNEFKNACKNGDMEKISALVKRGLIVDKDNYNSLILASAKGHLSIVKFLVEKGVDVHAKNDEALRHASGSGHLPVVQYLVEKGADIHAKNDYALISASGLGHLSIVQYLLSKGSDIHSNDDDALRAASENGHLHVVQCLVENGANIHANDDFSLRNASENGKIFIVKYLVENGADIYAEDDYSLRMASQNGHLSVVKYLVENGANIHARDDESLEEAKYNGHTSVVKYLEERRDSL